MPRTGIKKKIGLLFSQSGTISIIGKGQLQASILAIEEINRSRSIKFEPIIRDSKSNPRTAAEEAYGLFAHSKIDALVGCYMSSVRNAVIPVLNETGGLLLYPTLYEGEQKHPNIFYLGAVPNQQVGPLLSWAINKISSNFVLIGSDYVYPRSTNRYVRSWVQRAGGRIVSEKYFSLGCSEFGSFFKELKRLSRSFSSLVIFSTIVGTSVVSFYKEYRRNELRFSIISPITSEREFEIIGKGASAGHYCTSAYFQNIETDNNNRFVRAYRERFGDEPISREMASAYEAIHLLSMAYEKISTVPYGKSETEKVRIALKNLSFQGPQGKVIMDPDTQHLCQWSRIGRVKPDGKIEIIWVSSGPIIPRHDTDPIGLSISESSHTKSSRGFGLLIGRNKEFLKCIQMAKIASKTSSNILITGKTGTGKDLFAKAIHEAGPRSTHPFIPINCVAIPRDLIISELFGYEEGSFTGANRGGKPGKFELANGGTLFLDEIGEMPIDMQVHLLRAVEENEIYRIGGTKPIRLDVRIIAATNSDLAQGIPNNRSFRSDLYYRLSVFNIILPLLCDRKEDIPILANHFLLRLNSVSANKKTFAAETLDLLKPHSWPGNIRELANVVERSFHVALNSRVIAPEHLPDYIVGCRNRKESMYKGFTATAETQHIDRSNLQENVASIPKIPYCPYTEVHRNDIEHVVALAKSEDLIIRQVLKRCGHNISQTSRLLDISRSTLYRKMSRYNIDMHRI